MGRLVLILPDAMKAMHTAEMGAVACSQLQSELMHQARLKCYCVQRYIVPVWHPWCATLLAAILAEVDGELGPFMANGLLDLCMSSLRKGHANLLCIVSALIEV